MQKYAHVERCQHDLRPGFAHCYACVRTPSQGIKPFVTTGAQGLVRPICAAPQHPDLRRRRQPAASVGQGRRWPRRRVSATSAYFTAVGGTGLVKSTSAAAAIVAGIFAITCNSGAADSLSHSKPPAVRTDDALSVARSGFMDGN